MKYSWVILLCLYTTVTFSAGAVYTQTDENGNVTYSDMPLKNSQLVVIPEVNTTASQQPPKKTMTNTPSTPSPSSSGETKITYTTFTMTSPIDQQTFQNQRAIPVEIKIEPALQTGDKIQLYVDGKPYGTAMESTTLTTQQLERGSHTISAALIDRAQTVLKQTGTATIYVQYARLGTTNK